ncbi:UDP-2,4-diacetamido-2,4,6-trideoxy-beta-L-altropyranose hydrolase [Lysinibacillus sp. NPDC096418]|uniref:UDP-2,4-diacetamido-2,4, 6-trideoxy-beta-L-altropyranose hydrolase n=1 Tax=Lysinibacillus sp. NPDC096418 TaxID=3364138 RepID=UPI0037F62BBF
MNVFIRVDASMEIGIGHVMRCLTLSEELKRRGFKVVIISAVLEEDLIQLIKNKGIDIYFITNTTFKLDYEQTRHVLTNFINQLNILIVDSYKLDIQWETLIKRHVDLLICIDDEPRLHNVDLLIDNNYKAESINFYKENMLRTEKLLGSPYIILRSEFTKHHKQNMMRDSLIHIFFGGTDNNNNTFLYSNKILECIAEVKVHVVVSNSFVYEETLKKLKTHYGERFNYSVAPGNMAKIMSNCTIAIGAPGTTTWERMAIGLPCAYLATNSNQIPILQKIQSDKLGIYLGEVNRETVLEQVLMFSEFLNNIVLQNEIVQNGKNLIDGQGSKRIADVIIKKLERRN